MIQITSQGARTLAGIHVAHSPGAAAGSDVRDRGGGVMPTNVATRRRGCEAHESPAWWTLTDADG